MKTGEELGYSPFSTIEDLPISEKGKIAVLEYLAGVLYKMCLDSDIYDGHCKSYDPMIIEKSGDGYEVHSYVFDYEDGGRHRNKKTLTDIEHWLMMSFAESVNNHRELYFNELRKDNK